MAEKEQKKNPPDTLERLLEIGLIFLLVSAVFSGLMASFRNPDPSTADGKFFLFFGGAGKTFPPREGSLKFPPPSDAPEEAIGERVRTYQQTSVYATSSDEVLFTVPAGTSSTIIGGPVERDGVKYWKVRFDDGREGYVAENELMQQDDGGAIGAVIQAVRETATYDTSLGRLIARVAKGTRGTIKDGPVRESGEYWLVEWDNGVSGWVAQKDLQSAAGSRLFERILFWFRVTSISLSIIFLTIVLYVNIRLMHIGGEQAKKLYRPAQEPVESRTPGSQGGRMTRWNHVLELAQSANPNDWKLAIIEADIILEDMVTKMGYHGDGLGEKLKQIETSDFRTLDAAFSAHAVRNRIAHEGSSFLVSKEEKDRVIEQYRQVFQEFRYI